MASRKPRPVTDATRAAAPTLIPDAPNYRFEGHVDFCGHHDGAGGFFIGGWIAHPWPPGARPAAASARFEKLTVERTQAVFYHREDVGGRGIGFIFFFPSEGAGAEIRQVSGPLQSMQIRSDFGTQTLYPTLEVLSLSGPALREHVEPILRAQHDEVRDRMLRLLTGATPPERAEGFVDFYGHHQGAGGWLLCGWLAPGWRENEQAERMVISFQEGDVEGGAIAVLYPRHELGVGSQGVVAFIRGPAAPLGGLCSVSLTAGSLWGVLHAAPAIARLREAELSARLRPLLGQAGPGAPREALAAFLARRPYAGEDTLSSLKSAVFLEIDELILCGANGVLLMGWCLARPGELRGLRLRCGSLASPVDPTSGIRIERPDVIEGLAEQGFSDPSCGFILFLEHAAVPGEQVYLEVETSHGLGYRTVPAPKLESIAAMKRILAGVDLRFGQVVPAFDAVLGPAISALNDARLSQPLEVETVQYGRAPHAPRFSVIVPLYGRLDYMEYQMAVFSAYCGNADVDFIYVLDDPPRRREAQFLFASVFEKFQVPFRALLLERNVGFAPASNVGLTEARGEYVAFLNSDVFPETHDWLERLAADLVADARLGVIGPTLLFEDWTVQHRGMTFERLAEFGGWHFGMHPGKGLRHPGASHGVERFIGITGACMLMRRALATQIGGFDETFVIGDFEDTDLCLKVQALGLACGVDPDVRLFHLERKSQAGSALAWRMNLTLYNAWQHERRWGETIARLQSERVA